MPEDSAKISRMRQQVKSELKVAGESYHFYSLAAASKLFGDTRRLPISLKILLENLLRNFDAATVTEADIKAFSTWLKHGKNPTEIQYRPSRVLLQDFTGVPAVVDLAAMRDAITELGGSAQRINPQVQVDLVIDHSVMVDAYASDKAFNRNVALEFGRNAERYKFLRWGQQSFNNFRVVPPGTGICHQVNLEYLSEVVWQREHDGEKLLYPDTLVGTDSHTTMANALGILAWGVGGIEAEAAMLGQPVSMLIPEVVGCRLHGKLVEGVNATDLVLRVTEMLREFGVVEKFVEFFGPGINQLQLADRATISNMSPEYGATCGIFPIDAETIDYLRLTGRNNDKLAVITAYAKQQGLWHDPEHEPVFTHVLDLDLGSIRPALAGPKRPQDRVLLEQVPASMAQVIATGNSATSKPGSANEISAATIAQRANSNEQLRDGDVVIAAITSCTNTSNPQVMVAAGLLARKANQRGVTVKPWVKTSLAPGSQVVSDYLQSAGLDSDLDRLGFNLVGYGCTTCIGNSGPLDAEVTAAIQQQDLSVAAVLSGNRNFEGRVHPLTKANFLASPPLVVAYALAGNCLIDFNSKPLALDGAGKPVFLADLWPSNDEIKQTVARCLTPQMFEERYRDVFVGPDEWRSLEVPGSSRYQWDSGSTYVQKPPYFNHIQPETEQVTDITGARVLLQLADSITTDHISPAGSFSSQTPAGQYLQQHQVAPSAFNSYGSRRGNHQVMMRGTFANIRIRNELAKGTEGGFTTHYPSGEVMPIFDAAMRYADEQVPLIVLAGKEYGTGSSRDWAAKGTKLLGIKAIIAESFERIHRSNLVGMGVLPLQFTTGVSRATLALQGTETFDIIGISQQLKPRGKLGLRINRPDGSTDSVELICRIDTDNELTYYRNDGVLSYVLRRLAA